MPRNFIYFDLETQRSAGDVGGWDRKDRMGMSVGVTYSTATGCYEIFRECEVESLIAAMSRADLVIGFNHVDFDYKVLQGYSMWEIAEQMRSFDLLHDLEKKLGHRIKLDDIAVASLGTGKTADGLDAIRWWREGKIRQIAEYCCFDVKVTRLVHEFGVQHGYVRYLDRFGREATVEVQWPDWR
jgi:DEAD/DEAH box helicase domain-containing protein